YTVHGFKVKAKCITSSSSFIGAFFPSLGVFLEHSNYCKFINCAAVSAKWEKRIRSFAETVTGYDENGTRVSFKPCPSGEVWIGFKCAKTCDQFWDGTSFHTMYGVEINGYCVAPCQKAGDYCEPINLNFFIFNGDQRLRSQRLNKGHSYSEMMHLLRQ
ncbi:MAG: hypothetical protein OXJ52_05085, partial [Oligoflexia bacterium]|nr:hypothetical protein [Oligoflexia bacterium]